MTNTHITLAVMGAVILALILIGTWVRVRAMAQKNLTRDIIKSLQDVYKFDNATAIVDIEKRLLLLPGPFGQMKFKIEEVPCGRWRIFVDTANYGEHRVLAPEHFSRQISVGEELTEYYTPSWETPDVSVTALPTASGG